MKTFPYHYAALALIVTLLAVLLPRFAVPSTYTAAIVLILGIGTVVLITWRNALPTETVAQLIQRTEDTDGPSGARARARNAARHS